MTGNVMRDSALKAVHWISEGTSFSGGVRRMVETVGCTQDVWAGT